MIQFKWLVGLASFLLAVPASFAADSPKILGVWRLVSFQAEYQATGERENTRGTSPTGYIIFTPEGRMMVVITNEGRTAPKTDQNRADLFNTMVAYTGTYRIEGDKWITKVDVSWNPAQVGTEQPRFFRVDGDRLQEMTDWSERPGKGMGRTVITYQRAN